MTSKSGLGKTHLLYAIGNKLIENEILCCYIEPDSFTNKITKYARNINKNINSFVKKLSKYDVLLFDDIQNLGDRSVTLKVLLQILNLFHNKDKQIVIASDKIPRELSGFESRFITRFSSGITSIISRPLNDDLTKILKFKLDKHQLLNKKWDPEAIKFIVRNYSQSIRSIEGAIKKIACYVEDSTISKYTYNVISNIFKENKVDSFELTPRRIINIVTGYYNISKNDIKSKKRNAKIVTARHMAIWMIRKLLIIPFKEIGYIFGDRDHSTIMSSIKTTEQKISTNEVMRMAAEKIENKIKNVI